MPNNPPPGLCCPGHTMRSPPGVPAMKQRTTLLLSAILSAVIGLGIAVVILFNPDFPDEDTLSALEALGDPNVTRVQLLKRLESAIKRNPGNPCNSEARELADTLRTMVQEDA